jgi:hypothetical protein
MFEGWWLGRAEGTNEHLVALSDTGVAMKFRTVKRDCGAEPVRPRCATSGRPSQQYVTERRTLTLTIARHHNLRLKRLCYCFDIQRMISECDSLPPIF